MEKPVVLSPYQQRLAIAQCLTVIAAVMVFTFGAVAQTARSFKTVLDLSKCLHIRGETYEDYGTWRCKG